MKTTIPCYAILLIDKKTKAQEFALCSLLQNPRPFTFWLKKDASAWKQKLGHAFEGKTVKVVKANLSVEVAK